MRLARSYLRHSKRNSVVSKEQAFKRLSGDLKSLKEAKVEIVVIGWGILLLPDAPLLL